MKRPFWPCLLAAAVLASCQPPQEETTDPQADAQGWLRAPTIETATLASGGNLRIAGSVEPGGRIVLRADSGSALATSADRAGRFALIVPAPAAPGLFTVEIQQGQESVRTGARLLIVPNGPRAVIQPGAPTRRLDGESAFGAIDSDGHTGLLSGFGAPPPVDLGGVPIETSSRPGGWVARTPADTLDLVRIGGRPTAWPGPAATPGIDAPRGGWRVDLREERGGRLTVWLPTTVTRR